MWRFIFNILFIPQTLAINKFVAGDLGLFKSDVATNTICCNLHSAVGRRDIPFAVGNRILNANWKAGKQKHTLSPRTIISMVEVDILAKIENSSLNEPETKPNNTLVSKLNPQIVSAMLT